MKVNLLLFSAALFPVILLSNRYSEGNTRCDATESQLPKIVISYSFKTDFHDQSLTMDGTLFYHNGFILEPVYRTATHETVIYDHEKKAFLPDTSKTIISKEIEAYYLLDLKSGKGMEFPSDGKMQVVSAFNLTDKKMGLGMIDEPFFKNGMQTVLQRLAREKDTIIGSHNCTLFSTIVHKAISQANRTDTLVSTRIAVDKLRNGPCFSFISHKLCEQLGGSVIMLESMYSSGLRTLFQFEYKNGFLDEETVMMDKYTSLYQANRQALDTLK